MTTKEPILDISDDEYAEYYHQYISLFRPRDFFTEFRNQPRELEELLIDVLDEECNRCHKPYTWTLKQVVGHLIDCERIFSTRALRIGVGDSIPIPGIDQNIYVDNMDYGSVEMAELLNEFRYLRLANSQLLSRMSEKNLAQIGTASNQRVSCRANFHILAGHVVYHMNIMAKRLDRERLI